MTSDSLPEFSPPSLADLATGVLLTLAIIGSVRIWIQLLRRRREGLPLLERADVPRPSPPLWAVIAALGWILFNLADRIVADVANVTIEPSDSIVMLFFLQTLMVLAVLLTLLFASGRFQPADIGLRDDDLKRSFDDGADGFLAAVLPTGLLLAATVMFRSQENQHPLLQVLGHEPDGGTLLLLGVTVIILGPLAEELLFRGILQGWLVQRLRPDVAIWSSSLIFAIVHGWKDGIALIPLSLILGYVYDRRHDLFAVTAIHGLFNAINLLLMLLSMEAV